ncbi:MAG: hypothetical protein JMN25_18175 [gamma proteobacterium endosymbiont of Lamellibrachia anaximandri]|nr:hypothetical protein [gamma proteobacterium endosymbiont of Lamellibrachia anaximandri]
MTDPLCAKNEIPTTVLSRCIHDLKAHGMRSSLLAAFLYSRAVKIPMLPLMVHYFGTLYTGLYVVNILLFSVLSGVIMEQLERGTPQGLDYND